MFYAVPDSIQIKLQLHYFREANRILIRTSTCSLHEYRILHRFPIINGVLVDLSARVSYVT